MKGYNASQGNFNYLGRIIGSDNPESIRYLDVLIQSGYYSIEFDYWYNQTKNETTNEFLKTHYKAEYREFNFELMKEK